VSRQRLDDALVERGLYPSRARARDAVRRGTITVDGEVALKPARTVNANSVIATTDEARAYVSRAALKLKHGMRHFGVSPAGRACLDIGASTGGFTQVLLEQGASHVTAIDVGHDQMAPQLRDDPRITLIEGLNARGLTAAHLRHPVSLVVCDVSFISLKLALPAALDLAAPGAELVAPIKPQFEAGRDAVGKGGIVADPAQHQHICRDVAVFLESQGWRILGLAPSPVEGGDGNREFLIAARKARAD